jgi:tetratricopeptide (TPR) repeat protein
MLHKVFLGILLGAGLPVAAQQPVPGRVDSNVVKTLFFAGLREKLNENYVKAAESFNKIITLDASNAAVYYELATLNYRQNKLVEAETAIKRAVALDTGNIWYWKLLAELYKRKGDMNGLTEVLNQLIRLDPANDAYYFDHSNALLLAGKTKEALQGYDLIEKKFGSSAALNQARERISLGNRPALDDKALDKLLREEKGDVESLIKMAQALYAQKRFEETLIILKKARVIKPVDFRIDLGIGDVHRSLKRDDEAIKALKLAFSDPEMPEGLQAKIIASLIPDTDGENRRADALELSKIALKLHPDNAEILALQGEILYKQGDLASALPLLENAMKNLDQSYVFREQIVKIQISLGKFQDAIKTGEDALTIYPNQASMYYYVALAQHRQGQDKEALITLKSGLQLDEENGKSLELYGDLLFITGDKNAAMQHWQKAKAAGNDSKKLIQKINEKKYME